MAHEVHYVYVPLETRGFPILDCFNNLKGALPVVRAVDLFNIGCFYHKNCCIELACIIYYCVCFFKTPCVLNLILNLIWQCI